MYIVANKTEDDGNGGVTFSEGTYTDITNLSFAPSADLVGASIPINEFGVDIHTTDKIEIGAYAKLYDDTDKLWASYWVIYSERIDIHTLRMRCQSDIALLDRVTLPATFYDGATVKSVLDETIVRNSGTGGILTPMDYALDSSFNGETVTGFCPEQTARERLLWICFSIGAYVKSFFNLQIEILPIDEAEATIPMADTYWKPTVTYNDWVTAITCKAYSFVEGTPQITDTYVKDANGTYYIVTETGVTLSNPETPNAAPDNTITIDGVYLVNNNNVSRILNHLSQWYFERMEVDLDIINNATNLPGDKVVAFTSKASIVAGYINSARFTFGLQSKAAIHLTAVEDRESGNLTINCVYEKIHIARRVYLFPVGYSYAITNPYIDRTIDKHRYIFRPLNESATGTIVAGKNTNTQQYEIALDLSNNILYVISVDEVTEETGEITIGVIA